MVSRVDRGPVANWWWTIDRWFLAAFLALMVLGIVLSFAASPAVAERIGLDPYHFVTRQIFYMVPALAVMIGVSFLDARHVRRLALTRTRPQTRSRVGFSGMGSIAAAE